MNIGFYEAFQIKGKGKGKVEGKEEFMQGMKAFFEVHGHCKVPRKDPVLGQKFKNVRHDGMKSLENLTSYTQEEIEDLKSWGVFANVDRREGNGRKTKVRKENFILIN